MAHPTLCVGGPLNGQVVDRKGITHTYTTTGGDVIGAQCVYHLRKVVEHLGKPNTREWLVLAYGHVPACDAVALAIKLDIQPLGNPYAIVD